MRLEDEMDDERTLGHEGRHSDGAFRELEVVAYVGEFKIVGMAHFGVGSRASSQRASDYIRAFADRRLTLSDVRVYDRVGKQLVDTAPFILLNMDKVDLIFARDETAGGEAPA